MDMEHTIDMSENATQDFSSNLMTEITPAFSQQIRGEVRKFVRTAQTFAPGLVDTKFAVQRHWRRLLRRPSEVDYRALALVAGTLSGAWVDVGANRGQTIDAMRLFSDHAPIIAFEPNVRLANGLTQQYRGDPLVTIHAVALGDEAGGLTLYIPAYRGFMFDGLASLIREEASTWLEDRVFRYDPSLLTVDEMKVEVVRLDDFALTPTFMKLDVQGYELAALRGASGTIDAHHPVIMVEAAPKEGAISEFLTDYGYEIFAYRPEVNAFVPGEGGLNSFFLAGSHRAALPILRTCG
jgi:FkbM family methyltransferase